MFSSHRLRFLSALLLLAPLLMAACGGSDDSGMRTTGKGGKIYGGVYRMNILRGSPNGLDPVLVDSKHADDIASQVFDRLIDLDDSLHIVPMLSRTLPEIGDSGRSYTFHLRTDVTFHDDSCFPGGRGRRVTAEDVRFSLTRCCDPRTLTVAFWAFKNKVRGASRYYNTIEALVKGNRPGEGDTVSPIEGLKVIDDSTFRIELESPYTPFIYYLVNTICGVVPREAVQRYGRDFLRHPVGSGPFQFVEWDQQRHLILRRNPLYWEHDAQGNRLPFLDEIRYTFIQDDKTQLQEFTAGNLEESFGLPTEQFASIIDPATHTARPEFRRFQVQQAPAMLTWFLDFNTAQPPFNNALLRRAMSYAIDRERLVRFTLQNSPAAPATHGLIPPVFEGYPINSVRGYDFNADSARALLAQAGYPNGAGLPPLSLHIYPEPRLQQVALAVQEMLKSTLNMTVQVKTLQTPQLLEQSESGALQFWGTRWYGDYPDPETFLLLLNGALVPDDPGAKSYPNSTRWRNHQYDSLLALGTVTADHAAQSTIYAQAETLAMSEAPLISLFYEMYYRLVQPRVRDQVLNAMGRYRMKMVWLAAEQPTA